MEDNLFRFKRVRNNSKLFLAMTSLTLTEFFKILPLFEKEWNDYKKSHGNVGRPSNFLRVEDMLVFILYYLKCYPLQEVFAYTFGMSQGDANYWIHLLSRILRDALGRGGNLPERIAGPLKAKLEKELERRKAETSSEEGHDKPAKYVLEVALDGTERRRQRPGEDKIQRQFYSGKSKSHAFKYMIIGDLDTRMVYLLSDTLEGKKGDKRICDEAGYKFPEGTNIFVDKAFQGYQPEGVNVFQPKKKPKNGELSAGEKEINSVISGCRVVIEHIIAGIKRLRIAKDIFRNTKENFEDLTMEIACGLHNLREANRAAIQ